MGLLPRKARTAGGYRDYLPEEVGRLRYIIAHSVSA
jgi:DNA-binding transcriptional MerR regulator